jgi:TolB-like protein/DNA-binding winged helix-turn-helix (wHTH) protein/tetratricopeptide (TPR) repeat protein
MAVTGDSGPRTIQFGIFEADLRAGELRRNGSKIRLQEQPFQVLTLLLEHPGEVVTREELRNKLWPADTFVDFDHSLNAAIRRLRDALGDSAENPRFVETVARRGYRFLPPVGTPVSAAQTVPTSPPQFSSSHRRRMIVVSGVLLLGIALAALVLIRNRGVKGGTQPPIKSLAVLPLENLSGDPTQEYLADGITEALIGRLSEIRDLRVISRTSVMRFKQTRLSVPEIASTLHVDAIVEGSVIREGSRIRVHAQLIRGATDEHFWSEAYDREMRDVLALESDVAQSIARKVAVTVTGEEYERLARAPSVSPEVYESYLKGLSALDRSNSRAETEESIGYFDEALKRDPTFAPAYASLARAHFDLTTNFIGVRPEKARQAAMSAARKALELDPESAEAHIILADIQRAQWHWTEAEAEYRRALELNPSNAAAHNGLAGWLLCQGRPEEALTWAQRGRELDPLAVSGADIAWILFFARRYDEAVHELHSVLAIRPNDASALWYLGFVLIAENQPQESVPVLEKALSVSDRSPGVIGVLIRAYAHADRRTDALRLLEELKRRKQAGYVPAAAFVNAYLGLGERDQAFVWLEQAYNEKALILQFLKVHPFFDPVRDDPRFADLVRRVGLNEKPSHG